MKPGRLRIHARPKDLWPRFLVMPDDGSEPIELRISEAFLRVRAGEAAVATVRLYLHSIDIEDIEGRVLRGAHASRPVIFPDVEVRDVGGEHGDITAASWRYRAGDVAVRLRLRRLGRR